MANEDLKKCYVIFIAVLLAVLSSSVVVPSHAETVTKNFTLKDFDVTLTFPKTANPSDSVPVSVNAVAKSSINVVDLSIQVLAYVEGGDLQSIGSASLVTGQSQYQYQYVYKGNTLHKELSVTVPSNILRGALVAVISETTRSTGYAYYSYYPYYYQYYYDGNTQNYQYYWYYPYYYTYYYPETYYNEYVESKTLPCTYILATTPEYVKLKSDYDKLSSDYDKLSSQYQQATEQNKDLNDRLSMTTQELNTATILAVIFVATTVILAAYLLYTHRRTTVISAAGAPISSTPAAGVPTAAPPEKVTAAHEKKEVPKKAPET